MKNLLCTAGAHLKKGLIPLTSGLALIATAGLFSSLQAQSVQFDWVKQYGGVGANTSCGDVEKSKTIVLDEKGNIYNIGNFSLEVDFDPGPGVTKLSDLNNQRRFVTKSDKDGNLIWAKQFGNISSFTSSNEIAVDPLGNVYIGGYFRDSFDLDPGPATVMAFVMANSTTDRNIFVIKLDSSGNYIWGKTIEGTGNDQLNGMKVDAAGNIYATGRFAGTKDFDPGPNTAFHTGSAGYVFKWNTNGEYVWSRSFLGALGYAIDLDPEGNIYHTGQYSGTRRDFNPSDLPADTFYLSAVGGSDVYVSKLDPNGNFIWAKSMGGSGQENSYSIEVDKAGNCYIGGAFSTTADFDPGPNTYHMFSPGSVEAFICKLDKDGAFSWARQIVGTGADWNRSVAVSEGKGAGVYAAISYTGTVKYFDGKDSITLAPDPDQGRTLVIKWDTAGKMEWIKKPGANSIGSIIADNSGNVFVAGYFNLKTPVDFDPGPDTFNLNLLGVLDGYIVKYRFCSPSDTVTETACMSYEYLGETYIESGSYTVLNPEGCDESSVIVLNLTIFQLDPVISVDEFRLGTTQDYSTYQWLLNDHPIAGATQKNYLVTGNGKYRVVVTNESGCIDTSDAYTVTNYTSIAGADAAQYINVYPNPARDILYINSPVPVQVSVSSMEGKLVKDVKETRQVTVNDLAEGVYLLHISDKEGKLLKTEKFVKYK